jgi:hypothetical protein
VRDLLKGSICKGDDLREMISKLRALADDLESVCEQTISPSPDVFVKQWLVAKRAVPCLVGEVRGHPVVQGKYTATTELFFLNPSAGLARTLNRWYKLGSAATGNGDLN